MTPASERHTLHRGLWRTLAALGRKWNHCHKELPRGGFSRVKEGQAWLDQGKQKLFSSQERAQGKQGQGVPVGRSGCLVWRLTKDTACGVVAGGWAGRVPLGVCGDGSQFARSLCDV